MTSAMFCTKLDLIYGMKKKNMMKKRIQNLTLALTCAATVMGASSCDIDNKENVNIYYANAVVTVKPLRDSNPSFYMQLDDSTTLVAENISQSPFGDKEVRALAALEITGEDAGIYDKVAYVYAIDSILTKNTVPFEDSKTADSMYGTDPVEMIGDWMTVVEDGYITLRVRVATSTLGATHKLSLLTGVNPDDPYEVEFRHKYDGPMISDIHSPSCVLGDALVAFRLDSLPDTQGETVKLTLKWKSFRGERMAIFDYCTDAASGGAIQIEDGASFLTNIK